MTPKAGIISVTRTFLTTAFLCSFCAGSPTGDVALSDPHDLSVVPTSVNDIPDPFANQSPRER